jgi:hypothetical protein
MSETTGISYVPEDADKRREDAMGIAPRRLFASIGTLQKVKDQRIPDLYAFVSHIERISGNNGNLLGWSVDMECLRGTWFQQAFYDRKKGMILSEAVVRYIVELGGDRIDLVWSKWTSEFKALSYQVHRDYMQCYCKITCAF